MRALRRYQVYEDRLTSSDPLTYVGYVEGWDLTARQALEQKAEGYGGVERRLAGNRLATADGIVLRAYKI